MRRLPLIIISLAATGALTSAGFLAATSHHSKAAPGSEMPGSAPQQSAQQTASPCPEHEPSAPFTGVAVNSPIATQAGSFATVTGVHPGIVEFYVAFGKPFSQHEARQAAGLGALPLIQLNPRHLDLASITAGKWDSYLRQYAAAVRAFHCPLALSFGHEMNGWWYSWGRPRSSPSEFIAAWRHIYTIFAAEHATNVIWSWDPDHGGSRASEWWPGSAYVNWIGMDGYQRPGQTFSSVFGQQLANIRSFTSKPIFLAETAAAPGPQQEHQITGLFAAVRKYRLAGLVWFDINRKEQWQLEGNSVAISAFKAAVGSLQAPSPSLAR